MWLYFIRLNAIHQIAPELMTKICRMCHEDCDDNGVVVEAAAGFAARCKFNL